MKNLITILVLSILAPACLAQVDGGHDPAPECAPVECAWVYDTACSTADAYTNEDVIVYQGEGLELVACVVNRSTCTPKGTAPECVPEACAKYNHWDCQPAVVLGGPNPGAPRAL